MKRKQKFYVNLTELNIGPQTVRWLQRLGIIFTKKWNSSFLAHSEYGCWGLGTFSHMTWLLLKFVFHKSDKKWQSPRDYHAIIFPIKAQMKSHFISTYLIRGHLELWIHTYYLSLTQDLCKRHKFISPIL